jgi:hypothetical protein
MLLCVESSSGSRENGIDVSSAFKLRFSYSRILQHDGINFGDLVLQENITSATTIILTILIILIIIILIIIMMLVRRSHVAEDGRACGSKARSY